MNKIVEIYGTKSGSVAEAILIAIIVFGSIVSLFPMENTVFLIVLSFVPVVAVCLVDFKKRLYIMVFAFIIVFAVLFLQYMIDGFYITANKFIKQYNTAFEDGIRLFEVQEKKSSFYLFMFEISMIISLILKKMNTPVTFMFILIVVTFNMLFKLESKLGIVLLFVAGNIRWLVSVSGMIKPLHIIGGLSLFGILIPLLTNGSDNIPYIDDLHKKTAELADELRFGSDGLPKGELARAYKMFDEKGNRLDLKTKYINTMYLKGFVGVNYSDGKWRELSKVTYRGKNEGMLEWLSNKGFDTNLQYKSYFELCDEKKEISAQTEILNLGAYRKYVYLPYFSESIYADKISENRDYQFISDKFEGSKEYKFDYIPQSLPSELIYNQDWLQNPDTSKKKEYMENEKIYREFVYENYLSIDDKYNEILDSLFKDDFEDDITIYIATEKIRHVLSSAIKYNKTPLAPKADVDPLLWCLEESGEGNSPFFATTAVMEFRKMGIASRYAEGYIVTDSMLMEGNGKVMLTEENYHSWAEVYMDGVGWLPIDVTPGYYFEISDLHSIYEMIGENDRIIEQNEQADSLVNDTAESDTANSAKDMLIPYILGFPTGIIYRFLTCIVLFATVMVILGEILIMAKRRIEKVRISRMSENEKTIYNFRKICRILGNMGVNIDLNKGAEYNDKRIYEKFGLFGENEYIKIYSLAQKAVYGQDELLPYEQRVFSMYIEKLIKQSEKMDLISRIKMRYLI